MKSQSKFGKGAEKIELFFKHRYWFIHRNWVGIYKFWQKLIQIYMSCSLHLLLDGAMVVVFMNDIRSAENPISGNRKIINTIAILFLGIALGTFSKYLDFRQTELPGVLMAINGVLDIGNFLGRFAIWILIALCISIYSNSAIRASINVFVFFVGMVASYYLYSNYIAGFFPRSYAMIWFGFTAVSPLLAFVCWYAKGKSKSNFILHQFGGLHKLWDAPTSVCCLHFGQ